MADPFLPVCAVFSCVQTMVWLTHSYPACSVFVCPDNGMADNGKLTLVGGGGGGGRRGENPL